MKTTPIALAAASILAMSAGVAIAQSYPPTWEEYRAQQRDYQRQQGAYEDRRETYEDQRRAYEDRRAQYLRDQAGLRPAPWLCATNVATAPGAGIRAPMPTIRRRPATTERMPPRRSATTGIVTARANAAETIAPPRA